MLISRIHAAVVVMALGISLSACGAAGDDAQSSQDESTLAGPRPTEVPSTKCTTFYYDAPGGTIVGYCTIACSGGARCVGIKTAYHDQECESCLTKPPVGP